MLNLVVVDHFNHFHLNIENVEMTTAKQYLTDEKYSELRNVRVYNLCRSYKYQSLGYYVSLLAEARGHKIFPSISKIYEIKSQVIIRLGSDELDAIIQRSLAKIKSDVFVLSLYFGKNMAKQYDKLSRHIYEIFSSPLLRAYFVYNKKWHLKNVSSIALNDIPDSHKDFLQQTANEYFQKKRMRSLTRKQPAIYDLAILHNPTELDPPSDKKALANFMRAGEEIGLNVELITKDDFHKLPEFDALLIRATTAVNHYTYKFAQRAKAEGLIVIDDPESIVKCTNKVYLAELFAKAKIPRPRTLIIYKENKSCLQQHLDFPLVLKQPDSSFSRGVVKINDVEQLGRELPILLTSSEMIIAQEFLPTEFDWRIGILDKQPLFACKYYMAKGHWQIYNWQEKKSARFGNFECLDINEVPEAIVKTALKAANLIGDGFYGVDLKVVGKNIFIIEINDNPSIESGVEDKILKNNLYLTIMRSFLNRIQETKKLKQ